jgi:hypothetical protein
MPPDKPKTHGELEALVASGDIEVLLEEDFPADESLVCYLVQDNRRTLDEGEIYELVL